MWGDGFFVHLFLGIVGLCAGLAVSAGTFAFLIVIGVVPRMIGKCNRAADVLRFETAIICGGIAGNILSIFLKIRFSMPQILSFAILAVYGLSAGIFVGCIAVALAEILNTFPILFKRMQLKEGLIPVMISMALGKMAGAFFYFGGHFY